MYITYYIYGRLTFALLALFLLSLCLAFLSNSSSCSAISCQLVGSVSSPGTPVTVISGTG